MNKKSSQKTSLKQQNVRSYSQVTSKAARKGLVMLALGGIGEIGGNCYAYGFNNRWIIVDYGIAFPDSAHFGIDVECPDPAFFADKQKDILAIIVTHAHEDHIGGIAHLWESFCCPVYATKFAKAFLEHKLRESSFADAVPLHELHDNQALTLEHFRITAVAMSHSIPEARLLAIETPQGLIVHSGDWNGDHNPLLGSTDLRRLDVLAEQGVLALVADSTNVMTTNADMPSESDVAKNLETAIACCSGRVIVTCFASNVARLQSIAQAGLQCGRRIALVGRSMWRMNTVAREVGYLADLPKFQSAEDLESTPARQCLYIVTGSQGEPRAALTRMAQGSHPEMRLTVGDTVLYSSREIPGNEKGISAVHNNLALLGVRVIESDQIGIHASGHANRQQSAEFLKRLKPQILIPVHGEARHLVSHIALAKECGVPQGLLVQNGECVQFSSTGKAKIIDGVTTGKRALDGRRYIDSGGRIMHERYKIAREGVLCIALAVNEVGDLVGEPELSCIGLLEEDDEIGYDQLYDALEKACRVFQGHGSLNKHCESVEKTMRQQVQKLFGKRPWAQVTMVEV